MHTNPTRTTSLTSLTTVPTTRSTRSQERDVAAIVPGRIVFTTARGSAARRLYARLARHHYRPGDPATIDQLRAAWHEMPRSVDDDSAPRGRRTRRRLIGVAVLSWPVPMVRARLRHFAIPDFATAVRFLKDVRTVSRVIVHPQYRALGLATRLVRDLLDRSPTRYVDASATMGAFVGCFTSAGMTHVRAPADAPRDEPAYFVIDRSRSSR